MDLDSRACYRLTFAHLNSFLAKSDILPHTRYFLVTSCPPVSAQSENDRMTSERVRLVT